MVGRRGGGVKKGEERDEERCCRERMPA